MRAVARRGLGDGVADRRDVARVEGDVLAAPLVARASPQALRALAASRPAITTRRAALRERARDRLADAAIAAGDERDLAANPSIRASDIERALLARRARARGT